MDGPGTRATGIIVAMSSNTINTIGTDSKVKNGFRIVKPSPSDQEFHMDEGYVDHSTCKKNSDFQENSVSKSFQDVKLDQKKAPESICGRTKLLINSLVANSFTRPSIFVRLDTLTSGPELLDV